MAHITFHPFPRLPCELRLQIWEEACLKECRSFQAIHYVTMDSAAEVIPLSHNWDDSKPSNRSIYLWDAGLWTACQESRNIVAKHWAKQPRPFNDIDMYFNCSRKEADYYCNHVWPEKQENWRVRMLFSRVDGEHWRQTVHLGQDYFCIAADDWEPLARDWEIFSGDLGAIAIEFDPSWNLSLKNKMRAFYIKDVPASLEFLLKLLFDSVRGGWGPEIKLIVRNVDWILLHSETGSQIRDCDEEYVEMPADEVEPCWSFDRRSINIRDSSLMSFFYNLDDVYHDRLLKLYCEQNSMSPGGYETSGQWFDIRHYFSILVPRTNQVGK